MDNSWLHFLRPWWFLALLPCAILIWLLWRRRLLANSWLTVVDPRLLPYLLIDTEPQWRSWPLVAVGCGGLLAILALAGPVWRKLEQPVFRQQSALVVLLDLSRSMEATDLKPSRLERARLKLQDILSRRREGQTALVVFAARAFVVSPLTNDSRTIASQVPSMTIDLMPEQGSRLDLAIEQARQLLKQAGTTVGTVLVIGDGVDGTPTVGLEAAVDQLIADGYRLSLLGVGSPEGAPIPVANGGFFKDASGAIVLTRLDETALESVARRAHGSYRRITVNDNDIDALLHLVDTQVADMKHVVEDMKSDQWYEEGPWLLLPLLVLGALTFRRGYLVILWMPMLMTLSRPVAALDWQSLWQRPDQRAQQVMNMGDPAQASELFQDPKWRAAAKYRAGDYQSANDALNGHIDPDSLYNQGNALAQLGRLPEAVTAYEAALKSAPHHQDAIHNRDLIKQWLDQSKKEDYQSSNSDNHKQNKQQKSQSGEQQQSKPSDQGDKNQTSEPATPSSQQPPSADVQSAKQQSTTQNSTEPALPTEIETQKQEQSQANEQWLRRIPDDPGGLWRRKFLYQYRNHYPSRENQQSQHQSW